MLFEKPKAIATSRHSLYIRLHLQWRRESSSHNESPMKVYCLPQKKSNEGGRLASTSNALPYGAPTTINMCSKHFGRLACALQPVDCADCSTDDACKSPTLVQLPPWQQASVDRWSYQHFCAAVYLCLRTQVDSQTAIRGTEAQHSKAGAIDLICTQADSSSNDLTVCFQCITFT